jgi:hypothetical protein
MHPNPDKYLGVKICTKRHFFSPLGVTGTPKFTACDLTPVTWIKRTRRNNTLIKDDTNDFFNSG